MLQSTSQQSVRAKQLPTSEQIVSEVRRQRVQLDRLPDQAKVTIHLNLQNADQPVTLEVNYKCR